MALEHERLPCPGGCGNDVHRNATECPHCGFRSELSRLDELLSSLSTISSILTGFGLAALVTLATGEPRAASRVVVELTVGVWIVSSLLLLGVMVCSEVLRRRESGSSRIRISFEEDQRLWGRSELLLGTFALALLGTAAGVVLLGFSFSLLHGAIGCAAAAAAMALIWRMW